MVFLYKKLSNAMGAVRHPLFVKEKTFHPNGKLVRSIALFAFGLKPYFVVT